MARVTVEDCIEIVPNRFDLVLLAAKRARDIAAGANITVSRDNDKNPVVALREIADRTVPATELEEALIKGMQKLSHMDDREEDLDEDMDQAYGQSMEMEALPLADSDDEEEDSEDDDASEDADLEDEDED